MPSPNKYDTTLNCGPGNPLTMVNRGPVNVKVRYDDPLDPRSQLFLEIQVGRRRARTAYLQVYEHELMVKELLEHLGFTPTVLSTIVDPDEDYS